MGDAEIGFGLHDHGLGRDTTGPIDRQLAGQDVDGIAEVGSGQVGDADQGRIAEQGTVAALPAPLRTDYYERRLRLPADDVTP